MPLQKVPMKENNVYLVARNVKVSFARLEGGDEIFNRKIKAQDPMIVTLVSRFKWADFSMDPEM